MPHATREPLTALRPNQLTADQPDLAGAAMAPVRVRQETERTEINKLQQINFFGERHIWQVAFALRTKVKGNEETASEQSRRTNIRK
jgi:hypothetical protein